jgi:hypothetical protein
MDTRETNKVTMHKTVDSFLDKSNSIWNDMAPFANATQRLKANLAAIDSAVQKQEAPSGAGAGKAAARDALEDAAFLMAQALSVLGHTSSDHELKARVDLSRSDFDRLGDEELSHRAKTILDEANARKTELAAFNITQASMDDFSQALQAFNSAKTSPRTAVVERMTKTQSIPVLLRDNDSILRNELDPLVNLFQPTHPEFVAGYRSARVIIDRAASHGTATATTPPPSGGNA